MSVHHIACRNLIGGNLIGRWPWSLLTGQSLTTGNAPWDTWSGGQGNRNCSFWNRDLSKTRFFNLLRTNSTGLKTSHLNKVLTGCFVNDCSSSSSLTSRSLHTPTRLTVPQCRPLLCSRIAGRGDNSTRRPFILTTKSILASTPSSFQPYLRLIRFDKPIGTYLLFWPCSWSIAMAGDAGHLPSLYYIAMFGAGAFLMRGAGCIINDMWDKDLDKKVERTKTRPLATGEITHFQALVFLSTQLSLALAILLQFNTYSILLGAASMALVVTYPLAKRFTYWPQVMLGLTFNYGVLLGWSAVKDASDWSVLLPMYASGIAWTLVYDTIYAHQDKYDDLLIGVKSTALKLGDDTKPWLSGFSAVIVGGLSLSGYMCEQTWPFYVGVATTAAHLAHQLYTVDLNNPDDCAAKFRSNTQIGVIMFLATVAGTLLKVTNTTGEEETDAEK